MRNLQKAVERFPFYPVEGRRTHTKLDLYCFALVSLLHRSQQFYHKSCLEVVTLHEHRSLLSEKDLGCYIVMLLHHNQVEETG